MKKLLILAIMTVLMINVMNAQINRVYMQKIVLGNGLDITHLVTNTGVSHCPAYRVIAYMANHPAEVISTDNTDSSLLRIYSAGNGTSVPYYAVVYVQLGAFPSGWLAGETLFVQIEYIATEEQVSWDFTLPAGTGTINNVNTTQTVPPAQQYPLIIQGSINSVFPVSGVAVHCTGLEDIITDESGGYSFTVQSGQHYDLSATKEGYNFNATLGFDVSDYCYWYSDLFMLSAHPYVATNPLPANGAVDISVDDPVLSWSYTPDDNYTDPTYCKLYFPADNDEYIIINPTSQYEYTYYLGIPWEPETTYTWKVVPCYATESNSYDADSVQVWTFNTGTETGTSDDQNPAIVSGISAYPNPFRQTGTVSFEAKLNTNETGTLNIFNLKGQKVKSFTINATQPKLNWDGKDEDNRLCSPGVYLYRLSTGSHHETRKLVILK